MGMAKALKKYLDGAGVDYEVIDHPLRVTSRTIADCAHIKAGSLAKSVLLHDEKGYVVAVLASDHMVDLAKLNKMTDRDLKMAGENEIGAIFRDCELGAMPPVGAVYGMDMVMEEGMDVRPDVYFEAGDHRQLVHVAGSDFGRLMEGAQRGYFRQFSPMPSTP